MERLSWSPCMNSWLPAGSLSITAWFASSRKFSGVSELIGTRVLRMSLSMGGKPFLIRGHSMSQPSSCFSYPKRDLFPRPREHNDKRIHTELIDATTQQVIEARLGNAQTLGGLGLRQFVSLHVTLNLNHQIRAHPHIGRRLAGIFNGVPHACESPLLHRCFLIKSLNLFRASSIAPFAVFSVFFWKA